MHVQDCVKPDGRHITLYGRAPVKLRSEIPSPFPEALIPNPHLRWHPLRGEWVAYAAYRQGRVSLPQPQYDPLAPVSDLEQATELPAGEYDAAVFDNRFPSLTQAAHDPPQSIVETASAAGHCEVLVYSQDPQTAFGALPLPHIELLLQVWGDRTVRAAAEPNIRYILPFENRGAEMGVTLQHPHGQIYAYPFVPPVPARMQEQELAFYREHGRNLLGSLLAKELQSGLRLVYQGAHVVAFVPAWARYPYEIWIATLAPLAYIHEMSDEQRGDFARALKTVLLKYDALWGRAFPYLMVWYQAPADGVLHPEACMHVEFCPPYRSQDRLKYLAGTELGAGMFAMDMLPEEKASELQQIEVRLE